MLLIEGPTPQETGSEGRPVQADNDGTLIGLWLAGKADRTRRAYRDDVAAFLRFASKSLRQVTLADLVAWGETLGGLAPASRARKLGAVKSLAAFGHRIGYLAFDIGAPLKLPAVKNTLVRPCHHGRSAGATDRQCERRHPTWPRSPYWSARSPRPG